MEEWRPIEGFAGRYMVSSEGRVARILKCRITPNGYRYACLSEKWKSKLIMVHQLVATAFLGPCPGTTREIYVHHRDSDKTHNVPENLEYVTPKENTRKAFEDGLIGTREDHHSAKLTWEQVDKIREIAKDGRTQREIGEMFGVSQQTVWGILKGKTWRRE